jgi:hypothetical protein
MRESPRTFPRFPPENEVRSGLSAGGGSHERTRLWSSKFPASWENTGNFVRQGLGVRLLASNRISIPTGYDAIPYAIEQGTNVCLTEN